MAVRPLIYYLATLLVVSSFLCFCNLGEVSLWNNNEPRYAHTARNMLEAKDWITPMYKGRLRADKPILTYWLIMASAKLLNHGEVSEFAARFPFALLGVLGVVLIFFFGASLVGLRAGFISGLTLLFTLEYISTARRCLPDMALCFFISLTLFLFYKGYTSSERKGLFYLLAYLPAALGFLTKGPVAIVIPGGVILLYLVARRDLRETRNFRMLPGLVLFLAIVLPWFLVVGPKFSRNFFLLHNLKRAVDGLDHQKPWYFYFEAVTVPYAPALFLFPAGVWLWREDREGTGSPLLLPLLWVTFTFVLFSVSATKRVIYLLPIAPPLALTAGLVIERVLEGHKDNTFLRLAGLGIGLSFLSLTLVPFLTIYFGLSPSPLLFSSSILPLIALLYFRKERLRGLICLGALLFSAYALYLLHFLPQYDRAYRSAKPLASEISGTVHRNPLYRMGSFDAALEFYLGRAYIPKLSSDEELEHLAGAPDRAFILMRERNWRALDDKARAKLRPILRRDSRDKHYVLALYSLSSQKGNVTTKVVPTPSRLSTLMSPPCASTMR